MFNVLFGIEIQDNFYTLFSFNLKVKNPKIIALYFSHYLFNVPGKRQQKMLKNSKQRKDNTLKTSKTVLNFSPM